jgi:hypothetical protein
MPLLRLIQAFEVPTIQGIHNRVTEVREDVAEVEGESATGLEKIIGQPTEIACLGPRYDDEFRVLLSVPAGAELRLVGITERNMVVEREQLESTLVKAVNNPFFEKESVWICHQS